MTLTIPGTNAPTNLHLSPDQIHWQLDGDTIEWLKHLPEEVERGEKLYVLIHKDQPEPYIIMEADCPDPETGRYVDMFVTRTDHLGADTYTRIRRARQVPLLKRLEWLEKENAEFEAKEKERIKDELYENLGGDLYRLMHRTGFAHGRAESYPLAGPAYRRSRNDRLQREARSQSGVVLPSNVRSV